MLQTKPETSAFIPYIKAVGRGEKLKRDLTVTESADAMRLILRGQATDAQIGAFLIAQRVKGEAVDEVFGFIEAVRNDFIHTIAPRVENLLDLAVPYDGKTKTGQFAPAIAILLAEAGVPVILHGDRGVPTKEGVGPAPVLDELGIPTRLAPKDVTRMIESTGVGYLAASQYMPAWHALLPIRRQFGLRTVLNTIEKLFNPANAPYQISGFFHANYINRLRETQTGTVASWAVQGEEGSIEMAAGRKTHIFATNPAHDQILTPATVGLPERERITLPPDPAQHAALNLAVLTGNASTLPAEKDAQLTDAIDQVSFTVATMLHLLGVAPSTDKAISQVRTLISSGRARDRVERLRGFQ